MSHPSNLTVKVRLQAYFSRFCFLYSHLLFENNLKQGAEFQSIILLCQPVLHLPLHNMNKERFPDKVWNANIFLCIKKGKKQVKPSKP